MTVKEALSNMMGNLRIFIQANTAKLLISTVALSGKNGVIKKQLKAWRSTRDVIIITSFYYRGKYRRDSYEIFHYVNNSWIARLCNLHNYKYQRHISLVPTNGSGSNNRGKAS